MDERTVVRLADITRTELMQQRSLDYVRWLSCLSVVGIPDNASKLFLQRWPNSAGAAAVKKSLDTLELKAATAPGSSTDATWGAPLVGVGSLVTGFAQIARSASLFGRVPNIQQVPFKVKIPYESQAASYAWIGENSVKPVSKLTINAGVDLAPLKAMGIVVLSAELVKLAVPGTEEALRNTLINGLVAFQDKSLIDPTSTAVAGVRPASITAGLTPTTSTGNVQTDVTTMLGVFFAARPGGDPVLIAGGQKAAQLRALNPGFGLPVITSEAAGGTIVAVDGSGLYVADEGVRLDISKEASIQMNDAPDSPPTAATIPSSLWQLNLIGFRVERFLNFVAVPGSVAYVAA